MAPTYKRTDVAEAYTQIAKKLRGLKENKLAHDVCSRAMDKFPRNINLRIIKSQALISTFKDTENTAFLKSALLELKKVIKLDPQNYIARILASQVLLKGRAYAKARVLLEEVLEAFPGDEKASSLLAIVDKKEGKKPARKDGDEQTERQIYGSILKAGGQDKVDDDQDKQSVEETPASHADAERTSTEKEAVKEAVAEEKPADKKAAKTVKEAVAEEKPADKEVAKTVKEAVAEEKPADKEVAKTVKEAVAEEKPADKKAAKAVKETVAEEKPADKKAAKAVKETVAEEKPADKKAAKTVKEAVVEEKPAGKEVAEKEPDVEEEDDDVEIIVAPGIDEPGEQKPPTIDEEPLTDTEPGSDAWSLDDKLVIDTGEEDDSYQLEIMSAKLTMFSRIDGLKGIFIIDNNGQPFKVLNKADLDENTISSMAFNLHRTSTTGIHKSGLGSFQRSVLTSPIGIMYIINVFYATLAVIVDNKTNTKLVEARIQRYLEEVTE